MAQHRISCVLHEDTATFEVEGTFDGAAAEALRQSLEASGARHIVIDFSRVSTFQNLAMGVLARGRSPAELALRGLGVQQERLCRYLGFSSHTPLPRSGDC